MKKVKILLIGDSAIPRGEDKDAFIYTYSHKKYPSDYHPINVSNYLEIIKVNDESVEVTLQNTSDITEQYRLRDIISKSDVIILLFSLVLPKTLESLQITWLPLIKNSNNKIPIVLVGTGLPDLCTMLNNSYDEIDEMRPVLLNETSLIMDSAEAIDYLDCSAKDIDNLNEIIQVAAETALSSSLNSIIPRTKVVKSRERCPLGYNILSDNQLKASKFLYTYKAGGIVYDCYNDGTAVAIEISNLSITKFLVPNTFYHPLKVKTFTVVGFGSDDDSKKDKMILWPGKEILFNPDSNVEFIGNCAFPKLEKLTIPPSLKEIGDFVFQFSKDIIEIEMLKRSQYLILDSYPKENLTFRFKDNILFKNDEIVLILRNAEKDILIPHNITIIRPYAAAYLIDKKLLINFQKPAQLTRLCERAFYEAMIHEFYVPESCTEIGDYCFSNCKNLLKIVFSHNSRLEKIGKHAFSHTGITSIDIPERVKFLGDSCFEKCKRLSMINFPDNSRLEEFPANCFKGTDLRFLAFPGMVKHVSENFMTSLPTHLVSFDLKNNDFFVFEDGALFDSTKETLIYRISDQVTQFMIPRTVKKIYNSAFANCTTINEIQFEASNEMKIINLDILPISTEKVVLPPSAVQIQGHGIENQLNMLREVIVTNPGRTIFLGNSLDNWNNNSCIISLPGAKVIFDSISDDNLDSRPIKTCTNLDEYFTYMQENQMPKYLVLERPTSSDILDLSEFGSNFLTRRKSSFSSSAFIFDIIDFDNLKPISRLGEGTFGEVYLMKNEDLGRLAVKICQRSKEGDKDDANVLINISHPCLTKLFGFSTYQPDQEIKIAFQYVEQKQIKLDNTQRMIIIAGICLGMRYLHRHGIIHYNLKPNNILIDENQHAKITEFGISKYAYSNLKGTFMVGTPAYMAPEAFGAYDIDLSSDVYSFGITLLEFLTGKTGIPEKLSPIKLFKFKNDKESKLKIPNGVSSSARDLILRCTAADSKKRPTFDEILQELYENDFDLLPNVDSGEVRNYYQEVNESEMPIGNKLNNVIQVSSLVMDTSGFETIRKIGSGGFGVVNLMDDHNGNRYAVKLINNIDDDPEEVKKFIREINIMGFAIHPCVVRMIGFSTPKLNEPAKIIIEYMANGTVGDILKSVFIGNEVKSFTATRKTIIILGICYGMRYLHSIGIIHRDLKPDNVLLNASYHSKIGDFGISKFKEEEAGKNTSGQFTIYYASPESLNDEEYGSSTDLYSFGLMLLEIVSEKPAYPNVTNEYNLISAKTKGPSPIPDEALSLSRKIIESCLSNNPQERPTFDDIIKLAKEENYKFFEDVEVDSVQAFVDEVEAQESE